MTLCTSQVSFPAREERDAPLEEILMIQKLQMVNAGNLLQRVNVRGVAATNLDIACQTALIMSRFKESTL